MQAHDGSTVEIFGGIGPRGARSGWKKWSANEQRC